METEKIEVPQDMIQEFFLYLDFDIIVDIMSKSKVWTQRLENNFDFWAQKAYIDFKVNKNLFMNTFLSAPLRYLQLLTYNHGVGYDALFFLTEKQYIKRAIKNNKDYLLIPEVLVPQNYDTIIKSYVKRNDVIQVKKYLQYIKQLRLYDIKTLDMLNVFLSKDKHYAERLKSNGNIIEIADLELIKYLYPGEIKSDLLRIFSSILQRGDIEVFNYLYSKLDIEDYYIYQFIDLIFISGNEEFIDYVLDKLIIDLREIDPSVILINSAKSKNLNFYIKQNLKYSERINYKFVIEMTYMETTLDILKYILTQYKADDEDMHEIIVGAGRRKDVKKLLDFLIDINYDFNKITPNIFLEWDIHELIYCLNILKNKNIIYEFNMIYSLIDAIKLKDKYYIDSIIKYNPNYSWSVEDLKNIKGVLQTINYDRLINYVYNMIPQIKNV